MPANRSVITKLYIIKDDNTGYKVEESSAIIRKQYSDFLKDIQLKIYDGNKIKVIDAMATRKGSGIRARKKLQSFIYCLLQKVGSMNDDQYYSLIQKRGRGLLGECYADHNKNFNESEKYDLRELHTALGCDDY